jgi:hypothetical protein
MNMETAIGRRLQITVVKSAEPRVGGRGRYQNHSGRLSAWMAQLVTLESPIGSASSPHITNRAYKIVNQSDRNADSLRVKTVHSFSNLK